MFNSAYVVSPSGELWYNGLMEDDMPLTFSEKMELATELAGRTLGGFDPLEAQVAFSRMDGGGWQCYIQRLAFDSNGVAIAVDPMLNTSPVGEGESPGDALHDLLKDLERAYSRVEVVVQVVE